MSCDQMQAFAEHLRANPEQARAFFESAGILDADGNLTQHYQGKGCDHCLHPLYAGLRCGVCGRWTDQPKPPVKTYSGGKPNYVRLSSSTELIIWYRAADRLPGYGDLVLAWTDQDEMFTAYLEGEPVEGHDDDRVWWLESLTEKEIEVTWWAEIKGPEL